MMRSLGLIVAAWSLFSGHRLAFGFVVLTSVGVVFFPSPSLCGSCVVP